MFKVLVRAYRTLSDPELRAAYDLKLNNIQQKRWKIFDKPVQAVGVEAEKRKRQGMLSLLYMRRIQEPRSPQMSIQDFENLLGVPREHLEFGMWYMREAGLVTRSDNGRLSITVKGVEELERCPDAIGRAHVETREDRLLTT
jgi:curved DNA-binding protein CbpA